ncbi:MAG: hypothetical protein NTY39_02135 [Campylobacterales bacterium]|nr:hypothetical protein [Campylobacterales bacterium]
MKKNLLILSLAGMATVLSAESKFFDGYSYGGIGFENTTYQESGTSATYGHIKSKATGTSPVYTTGNLVRVNDKYDFSLDFSSTLLARELSETWTRNGAALQSTNMDVTINSMRLLGHYKLDDKNRIVFGPSYSLNSFKRFNFKDTNPNDTYLVNGVSIPLNVDDTDGLLTEERVATLFATFGYWYESAPVATPNTFRFKLNALCSQPIWNSASNTGFEGVSFSSLSGYKMDINGYVGYPIMKGLELGMFVGYQYQRKIGDDKSQGIVWPDNTLQTIQAGLLASWNFRD